MFDTSALRFLSVRLRSGLALALAAFIASPAMAQEIETFDPENYSQEVTECDRLAGHREDPFSVVPGRSRSEMEDLEAAIEACEAAVAADPENPRLRYQLGRVYGYSGRGEEAMPHRLKAVEKGYPQSLFVIGYIMVEGMNIEQDVCRGAELIRRSGPAGRFAGAVAFPTYVLSGRFDDCADLEVDWEQMHDTLVEARGQARGYYQELLVANLLREVSARIED